MDNLKKYFLPFLVLGSFFSLAVVFRSFLMTNIIEPIALLLWTLWRIVASVNQNIYWIVLIAFCILVMIRLVPRVTSSPPSTAYTYKYSWPNPVEHWRTLIQEASLGKNELEHLRDGLKQVIESVVAQVERSDPKGSEEIPVMGKVSLSPAAYRFLFSSKEQAGMFSESRWFDIIHLAPRWFRMSAGKFVRQDMNSIDEILERMETEMDISHD